MKVSSKNLLYSFAASALITIIISAGFLQRVDRWAQDWLFQIPGTASTDIVIVGIDETAFQEIGPYNI